MLGHSAPLIHSGPALLGAERLPGVVVVAWASGHTGTSHHRRASWLPVPPVIKDSIVPQGAPRGAELRSHGREAS